MCREDNLYTLSLLEGPVAMQDGCHGNDAVGIEVGVGQSKVVDALVHLKHGGHLDTSRPTYLAAIQQQLVH